MAAQYGIDLCEIALQKLSSEKELNDRLFGALSELLILKSGDDIAPKFSKEARSLMDHYLSLKEGVIYDQKSLITQTIDLCVRIIIDNSTKLPR